MDKMLIQLVTFLFTFISGLIEMMLLKATMVSAEFNCGEMVSIYACKLSVAYLCNKISHFAFAFFRGAIE